MAIDHPYHTIFQVPYMYMAEIDMGLTRSALLIEIWARISPCSPSEEALNLEITSLIQTPRPPQLIYCRLPTNLNRPNLLD
jgi:hypothetical protein